MKMEPSHSHVPAVIPPHLDSICEGPGGGLILGASNRTGRYWNGSLWYFADADDAPVWDKCSAALELEVGLNDLVHVKDNDVLLASDSGSVEIWSLNLESKTFQFVFSEQQHDNAVTSVSINASKTHAVSGSEDMRIRIWDLDEMISTHGYHGHADHVNCVRYHPSEPDVFLSCGLDGRTLMWDLRKAKPACVIKTSLVNPVPTAVAWQPSNEHMIAIGTESGEICVTDVRSGGTVSSSATLHRRNISNLSFNSTGKWVASTSDDCTIAVTDVSQESLVPVYCDTRHKDFVRGLYWSSAATNSFYTSAWDQTVHKHQVTGRVSIDMQEKNEEMDTTTPNGDITDK